ncbi:MAG TPA: hypothetical protein VGO27_02510 [Candidatus Acidoferrum sp.]|nr:hypothetical protein [Candidatus Acidoferrum sp.]
MIRCFVFESDRKLQVFVELHELLIVASAERSELIRGKGVSERYRAKSREVVFEDNLLI